MMQTLLFNKLPILQLKLEEVAKTGCSLHPLKSLQMQLGKP